MTQPKNWRGIIKGTAGFWSSSPATRTVECNGTVSCGMTPPVQGPDLAFRAIRVEHGNIDGSAIAERYVRGTLSAEERVAFESHFVECEECRDRILLAAILRPPVIGWWRSRLQTLAAVSAVLALLMSAGIPWVRNISAKQIPIEKGSGSAAIAQTRRDALRRIFRQSELVLDMEHMTVTMMLASTEDGASPRRAEEQYQEFRREYRNLLLLYKMNEAFLQKQDTLVLQPAIHAAENLQNLMQEFPVAGQIK
jgi:hypothetical protein